MKTSGKRYSDRLGYSYLDLVGSRRRAINPEIMEIIQAHEDDEIGVSAISCWEIAKLVERGRLDLPCP